MTNIKKNEETVSLVGKLLSMAHDILHMSSKDSKEDDDTSPPGLDSIMMSEDTIEKSFDSEILKADDEQQLITGVVMVPEEEDAHGDSFDAPQIEKAAFDFMQHSQTIGLQHAGDTYEVSIVESFIAREEMNIGEQRILKGSWVMTVKVHSEALWSAVKAGTFTGFSIGGFAKRV